MSRKVVFLDRDGTIAEEVNYCRRPEDFHILPGVGKAIARLNQSGLAVVVVTNQSAMARGYLTLGTLEAIHEKMHRELAKAGARVDAIYYCPHLPEDGCGCRKPATGLFTLAAREGNFSLTESYMVGDKQIDIIAGRAIGSKTISVRTGQWQTMNGEAVPDFDALTLQKAVTWILRQERLRPSRAARRVVTTSGNRKALG